MEPDERGLIRVAFLPREAFCFYWEDPGKFNARRRKRLQLTQDKLMEKHGWKEIEEFKPYFIPEYQLT